MTFGEVSADNAARFLGGILRPDKTRSVKTQQNAISGGTRGKDKQSGELAAWSKTPTDDSAATRLHMQQSGNVVQHNGEN